MKKTVVILGAGASMDYGYPLWGRLKEQLIDFNFDQFVQTVGGFTAREIDEYKAVHAEFLELHKKNPEHTLDRIAYEIDRPKDKHLHPTGYKLITMTGFLLARVEMAKQTTGWVPDFQKLLVNHLVVSAAKTELEANFLDQLTIVSLNYDRSFEYFVSKDFYPKVIAHGSYLPRDFVSSKALSINNRLRVLKPHGYICQPPNNGSAEVGVQPNLLISETQARGSRYPNNDMNVGYGDPRLLTKDIVNRMGRHMYVVDERGENDYQLANRFIADAEQVFCLGLSQYGFNQSHFRFKAGQRMYLSNDSSDVQSIENQNPNLDILPMNGPNRLDARAFPQKFGELAF